MASRIALAFCVFGLTSAALADEISGIARIIDGRTIAIGSQTLRLAGIDTPEPGQRCERGGAAYDCGQEATWALAERLGRHWVLCDGEGSDADGAIRATCYLGGRHGIDVNAHMVRQGWALALPGSRYAEAEATARHERIGLWAGNFTSPSGAQPSR